MNIRTIAISLPDSPSATPHEFAEALGQSVAALSTMGDTWSAAIVGALLATVMRSVRTPGTFAHMFPDDVENLLSEQTEGFLRQAKARGV